MSQNHTEFQNKAHIYYETMKGKPEFIYVHIYIYTYVYIIYCHVDA
jgi:hypothetical protein